MRTLLLLSIICFSCNGQVGFFWNRPVDLGDMPEVKTETFNNIYVADEDICEEKRLPITRFAIEYPDSVEVSFPKNFRDHINLKYKTEGMISEELAIGNSTVTLNNKHQALSLLEGMSNQLAEQDSNLVIEYVGKKMVLNQETYVIQGRTDFSAYKEQGYDGEYLVMMAFQFPSKNKEMKSIIMSLMANENSKIKTFDEFETKGMIGELWGTFRYLE